jgi:transposase
LNQAAAMMFSLVQTLTLWQIPPRRWLTAYLEACARAGGQAPPDLDGFLPWNLTAERRQEWGVPGEEEVTADTS